MTPTVVRRCLTGLVPGLLVAALGCGLGDYEEKMTEQQQRADIIDKENKVLAEGPLEMPKVSGGVQPDVFLRPPKGINLRPEERRYRDRFYQYSKKGSSEFSNVYLGWAGKDKPEDFRNRVLSTFSAKGTSEPTTTNPWGRDGVILDTVKGEDSSSSRIFYIYLYPKAEAKVALIYEMPKPDKKSEALQASLNTLALDKDAAAQFKEFNKRRRPTRK